MSTPAGPGGGIFRHFRFLVAAVAAIASPAKQQLCWAQEADEARGCTLAMAATHVRSRQSLLEPAGAPGKPVHIFEAGGWGGRGGHGSSAWGSQQILSLYAEAGGQCIKGPCFPCSPAHIVLADRAGASPA